MATLANFLTTGSLGPLVLGMDPFAVITLIGDPEQESQKKNPLTLKYGSLQLVFWRHGRKSSQLRDITINFLPQFQALPPSLRLEDFQTNKQATEKDFRKFMHKIGYLPVHQTEQESGQLLVFLSGVVVDFKDELLNSIRISQREKRETVEAPLSNEREPTQQQILEMIRESEHVLKLGVPQAALLMAWAGLEATLRQAVLRKGLQGRIGVQPTILIRELFSEGSLSREETQFLEKARQLRTASVHGLAPVDIPSGLIHEMNAISRRMIKNTQHGTK